MTIPQVVDGGGWHTTIVLTNTTTIGATVNLSFHLETSGGATQPWNPPLVESTPTTGIALAAGSSLFLHTPGTAAASSVGWAQLDAPAGVVAYVVFSSMLAGHQTQDGTALAAAPASRFLVPFDNTEGLLTAVAVANSTNAAESISVNFRMSNGSVVQTSLPSMPALGHQSFLLPQQFTATANLSGLAEFYSSSGNFSMIALRANPTLGFTSAPVYAETGSPIITGGGTTGNTVSALFFIGGMTNGPGFPSANPASDQYTVFGEFSSYSASAWANLSSGQKFGACTVYDLTYDSTGVNPSAADHLLDAGNVSLSGPNLAAGGATLTKFTLPTGPSGPTYLLDPSAGTPALGGTYTLTGSGGTQVGPFSGVSATLPSSFTVTNWNSLAAINRAGPLAISWTGSGFDQVSIGASGSTTTGTTVHAVSISCTAAASLGTFSVPVGALALLPVTSTGSLSVTVGSSLTGSAGGGITTAQNLTPNLVGGGKVNYGTFTAILGTSKSLPVQ